jgi:hypothetical protein
MSLSYMSPRVNMRSNVIDIDLFSVVSLLLLNINERRDSEVLGATEISQIGGGTAKKSLI